MRIVSLVPSITEALALLGVGDDVVGVTDYCLHPRELVQRAERVGGTKDPKLDVITRLAPELVIANTDEQRAQTLEELSQGPWDLLVTETDSLAEVAETWTALGDATGTTEPAARERAKLEAAMARAHEHSKTGRRLSTLVPVWKDPWMASGGGTYIESLLGACGFDNVLAATPEKWVRFERTLDAAEAAAKAAKAGPRAEQVVHALPTSPDVVLLPTEPYAFDETHRDSFASLGIGTERVRVVDGELLTWWLSRSVQALTTFCALHDELVRVVDAP